MDSIPSLHFDLLRFPVRGPRFRAPSEPPDVGNWFSTYEYQSPDPDSNFSLEEREKEANFERIKARDEVVVRENPSKDEVSEESKCGDERFDFEVMNGGRSENVYPKGCAEHNSSSDKTMKILQQSVQDRTLQCNLGPTKYEETLSLNQGSVGCNQEALLMPLGTNKSPIRPPSWYKKMIPEKPNLRMKSNMTRKDIITVFTDTRTVPLACEQRAAVTKRKAVTEATNLQQSNAMEITGKWQCPQKRKPNTGPALKQLRLERWVHRI
ncbi:hypothetical protein SESBI_43184 [Sesbania bispinosa]|nr:hypothetical protein SESBI_43184 [Sesbania bispinosa]